MRYRPAIDGLRALAVVLVLLFHAKVPLFPGGYIGVDIFFVVSGYLITKLIYHEGATGLFTLASFYERRARRILPAFFVVQASILAIGASFMLPPDLSRLGSSMVAATAFLSNFYFWRMGENYLSNPPETEPLLHTWSLAIEEQFYLCFPIFLLAAMRLRRRVELIVLGAAFVSLALCVYATWNHPRAAFYFSPPRAWELLLGSWLAVTRVKNFVPAQITPALQVAGFAAIVVAASLYDVHTPFPGLAALVPCVGALLVIAWCDQPSRLIGWLSHRSVVWVGLISYPLYLWHWPALALARLALVREPNPYEIAALYTLAVALAALTWRYVERPIRAGKGRVPARRVLVLATAACCVVVAVGLGLRAGAAALSSPPPNVARILAAASDYAPNLGKCQNWDRRSPDRLADCSLGTKDEAPFDFALWGDSHAGAIAMTVGTAATSVAKKGLQLTTDGCPPLLRVQFIHRGRVSDCEARNEAAVALLRQHKIRRVILAGAWIQYVDHQPGAMTRLSDEPNAANGSVHVFQRGLRTTLQLLLAMRIDVLLVGPVPAIGWNVPAVLAAMEWRKWRPPEGPSIGEFSRREREILTVLGQLESEGVYIIYPHEQLCRSKCLVQLDGHILYSDSEHLTTRGADLLLMRFVEDFVGSVQQRP